MFVLTRWRLCNWLEPYTWDLWPCIHSQIGWCSCRRRRRHYHHHHHRRSKVNACRGGRPMTMTFTATGAEPSWARFSRARNPWAAPESNRMRGEEERDQALERPWATAGGTDFAPERISFIIARRSRPSAAPTGSRILSSTYFYSGNRDALGKPHAQIGNFVRLIAPHVAWHLIRFLFSALVHWVSSVLL